jgi:histidinol phosphatase-like enzyme
VDIDGTLTVETEGFGFNAYVSRTPNREAINMLNQLKENGYQIILWTSRFSEDKGITKQWLKAQGVKYDRIEFDKPFYDGFICDKSWSSVEGFYLNESVS